MSLSPPAPPLPAARPFNAVAGPSNANKPKGDQPEPVAQVSRLPPRPRIDPRLWEKGNRQYRYEQVAKRFPPKEIKKRDGKIVCDEPVSRYMHPPKEPRPRRRLLNEYEVVRHLGEGGYGNVCVVRTSRRDPDDQHPLDLPHAHLALKAMRKKGIRQELSCENTFHMNPDTDTRNLELRNLVKLKWHPFIAGLYDTYSDPRNVYMLTELAPLGSFKRFIVSYGPFSMRACQFYLANMVLALEYVHSQGLIHCDVKPENFFVGADGYLMLGDFGLATAEDLESAPFMVGTMQYMPPEALGKEPVKREERRHLDWWAVGCIFFEVLTMSQAFPWPITRIHKGQKMNSKKELKCRISNGMYRWPEDLFVEPVARNVVDGLLRVTPAARYGVTTIPFDSKEGTKAKVVIETRKGRKLVDNWKNVQIRKHPFMYEFPWKAMGERRLVAPRVPIFYPQLDREWHLDPLPHGSKLPGLSIKRPAPHFDWNNCFESTTKYAEVKAEKAEAALPPRKRRRLQSPSRNEDRDCDKGDSEVPYFKADMERQAERHQRIQQQKEERRMLRELAKQRFVEMENERVEWAEKEQKERKEREAKQAAERKAKEDKEAAEKTAKEKTEKTTGKQPADGDAPGFQQPPQPVQPLVLKATVPTTRVPEAESGPTGLVSAASIRLPILGNVQQPIPQSVLPLTPLTTVSQYTAGPPPSSLEHPILEVRSPPNGDVAGTTLSEPTSPTVPRARGKPSRVRDSPDASIQSSPEQPSPTTQAGRRPPAANTLRQPPAHRLTPPTNGVPYHAETEDAYASHDGDDLVDYENKAEDAYALPVPSLSPLPIEIPRSIAPQKLVPPSAGGLQVSSPTENASPWAQKRRI